VIAALKSTKKTGSICFSAVGGKCSGGPNRVILGKGPITTHEAGKVAFSSHTGVYLLRHRPGGFAFSLYLLVH
jgi:hypothetical protein